ncbi:c-type cytochrome [Leisingera aquimarina]|uniref:c-type cytochrome n=1 Tax=Leisingera aquimarina TaxID=476529 RepID=UPI0004092C8F|nr:c-type cytochrome [Leisingera aquimarina]
MKTRSFAVLLYAAVAAASSALAGNNNKPALEPQSMLANGLMMPEMNAARGRELFAEKGCVVCHSVNGVGGTDARALDADTMKEKMNPFEFAARMWRGAPAMITLQEEELGGQIELSGQELADIIAFVHHAEEQKHFSQDAIPNHVMSMMHHQGEADHHADEADDDH